MDQDDAKAPEAKPDGTGNGEGPVEPHRYVPSWMHMGDCAICGNLQDSPLHLAPERIRRDLFDI